MTYWKKYFLLLLGGYSVLSQEMHFRQDLGPILRYRKTNSVKIFLVFVLRKMNVFAAHAHDVFVIH
jgi:hypothetical protein